MESTFRSFPFRIFFMPSESWASPEEEKSFTGSPMEKKFDFGPRLIVVKPKGLDMGKENALRNSPVVKGSKPDLALPADPASDTSPTARVAQSPVAKTAPSYMPKSGYTEPPRCTDQHHASLIMKLDISSNRITQLEKERDEWKAKAAAALIASEGSLGDMLTEIEIETLREEVSRLRSLAAASEGSAKTPSADASTLAVRCAELETQVATLKKDKLLSDQKNKDTRNADLITIRNLQEQITAERRMRERMANHESTMQVVNVGTASRPSGEQAPVVTIKPRSNPAPAVSAAVPSFLVETVAAAPRMDSRLLAQTTAVLPRMPQSQSSSLGDDAIAEQWRSCLADKPASWKSIVSRRPGSNIFTFGSHQVACKKIGTLVMIQLGRETMMLDKFLETYGPKEAQDVAQLLGRGAVAGSNSASVTVKSILAAKKEFTGGSN